MTYPFPLTTNTNVLDIGDKTPMPLPLKLYATGENVSLGTVNKSKVPLGLSATYGQTGSKVAAGAVQSVIGVTFIYE